MNRERAKELLPIIQAYADGKTIQCSQQNRNIWSDLAQDLAWIDNLDYRIKPESHYRPWKPEEVPVGALILNPCWEKCPSLIVASNKRGEIAYGAFYSKPFNTTCKDVLDSNWTYSTDNGKTWQPCGVLVEE